MNKQERIQLARRAYELMGKIPRDKDGNPFTLEDTIRAILLKNPDMFRFRNDVLDILYCCLGTGIGWRNGRLGDNTPNNYIKMPPKAGGQGCWTRNFGKDDSLKTMLGPSPDPETKWVMQRIVRDQHQRQMQRLVDVAATISHIDERCQNYGPRIDRWYPISWYACHLCAPADAQLDFLEGAIETATLIVNARPKLGTRDWLDHQRTKQYATEILEVLRIQRSERNP